MKSIRNHLEDFLRGEITSDKLIELLEGLVVLTLDSATKTIDYLAPLKTEIPVFPADVRKMLMKYLNSEIDAEELSKWAILLTMIDAFVTPNWANDDSTDYYEHMWHILQQLATPEIDGCLTPDKVQHYLDELNAHY